MAQTAAQGGRLAGQRRADPLASLSIVYAMDNKTPRPVANGRGALICGRDDATERRPRETVRVSAVENILGQKGGHGDVGQVHDVGDAQINGYAADYVSLLSRPPTFLEQRDHVEQALRAANVRLCKPSWVPSGWMG